MTDAEADILVLGAGHNGLVAAAYLAKAGLKVLVLEGRGQVGGGCSTEELTVPGFLHDPCATIHGGIQMGPVLRELELDRFGLRYVYPDPLYASIFSDGASLITWRSVERSVKEIERFSKKDAASYLRLVDFWEKHIRDWYAASRYAAPRQLSELYALLEKREAGLEVIRLMASSPLDVVTEFFEEEHVRAHVLKASLQGGFFPDQLGYGLLVLTTGSGARHSYGWAFPEGGSIQLPFALVRAIRAWGGEVLTGAWIKEINVKDGIAQGVVTADGRTFAVRKALVAGLHVRQVFLEMVDDRWLGRRLLEAVKHIRTGLSEVVLHLAVSKPPRYRRELGVDSVVHCQIPETVQELVAAYAEYRKGNRHPRAPFQILCHTLLDSKRAPPGGHVLNVGHYAPYALGGCPEAWVKIKEQLLQEELQRVREYVPNITDETIVGKAVVTPVDHEAYNPMFYRGDIMGIAHVLSQDGYLRPVPGLSDYRTPVKRLYLTGACTHPGGAITGAPGRNCAMTVLQDLGMKSFEAKLASR